MSAATWRPVLGYPDYEVSSAGDVRRVTPGRGARAGHVLSPAISRRGYRNVVLRRNGESNTRLICQLVCESFHGARPPGMEVRHLDGNSRNDDQSNLAWGTHQQNVDDIKRHGTHRNSRKTHCKNGHAFDADNTALGGGRRRCKACSAANSRRSKARAKARRGADAA